MPGLNDITAVILAGGLGSRLRSVVADRPKILAEVDHRPFLAYILDQLSAIQSRQVVLCIGYLGEKVTAEFGSSYKGIRIDYSKETELLGTAGALRNALPFIHSDDVLVMNGDSYCQADLTSFWNWHISKNNTATLLLVHLPDIHRYGQVQLDDEDNIICFEEKGINEGQGWINAGIYLIKRHQIESMPADRAISIEREVFPAWIGHSLRGYRSSGRFIDIGTPESYTDAVNFFRDLVG